MNFVSCVVMTEQFRRGTSVPNGRYQDIFLDVYSVNLDDDDD